MAPIMPTIEPIVPVAEAPVAPIMPTIDSMSDISTPTTENMFTFPSVDSIKMEDSILPTTQPIIEPFVMNQNNIEENSTIAQTITEPIIVTDYNKQYDPVMPTMEQSKPISKVDFKEIINAIRECSNKIEKYGYKIELEEYDLSTLYQVVFKIEK